MNEQGIPTTPKEIFETLNDGREVTLTQKDGMTAVLKVRKVSQRDLPKMQDVIQRRDEAEEVAFYLGKPVEFVESLTDESQDAAIEEGRSINFLRFGRYLRRQVAFVEMINSKAFTQAVEKAIADSTAGQKPGS